MNGTKRKGAGKADNSLFDNKPVAKPAKLPYKCKRELIDKFGMPEAVVDGLPVNVAFARLYAFREGRALSPEQRAAKLRELAELLRVGAGNRNWTTRELVDAITETACACDRDFLNRVAVGLAAAIEKQYPAQPAEPAAPF